MGKAICRAMPVPGGRFFGAFEEKTLECNAAARRAIDKVCNQGGYTQAWAHNAGEDGFVAMTKIPVVILVKLLLSIPKEGHEAEVQSLMGAYGICMAPTLRTCMNVIAGRRPSTDGSEGFVLDKFALYYPKNADVPAEWASRWPLLAGYSFRTAVLSGALNRASLHGLRVGTAPVAAGTSFDRLEHGLVVDDDSEYEDCAYVQAVPGESDEQRLSRIEAMVTAMESAYGGSTLALSFDPAEREQGVTALRSEWELLKKHLL